MLCASKSTLAVGRASFRANRASRSLSTTSTTHFSLFNWFSPKSPPHNETTTTSAPAPAPSSQSPSPSSTSTTSPDHISSASSAKTETDPPRDVQTQPKQQGKLLAKDQELLTKLLDREGGSAGVSIVNGKYEEGLGPESKKNMFRLI